MSRLCVSSNSPMKLVIDIPSFLSRNDDLPPEAPDDQPMPKTLSRLLRSSQQISQTSKPRKRQINSLEHVSGKESELTGKKKKGAVEKANDSKDGSVREGEQREPVFKRQRGESLKAYLERIDVESNARIMEAYRRNRKQSDRRKRCVHVLYCTMVTVNL